MGKELTSRVLTELPTQFITAYFVAGHPTTEESINIIEKAVQSGINAVEIGFPSKNPYLDGDAIKSAHQRTEIINFHDFLTYVEKLRKRISIPIWVMGYEEDLIADETYVKIAHSSNVDGFVIPNLSIAQTEKVQKVVHKENLDFIPVINHSMTEQEIIKLIRQNDVIYCQLYAGKTGDAFEQTETLPEFYNRIRNRTTARLMAGFGIKNSNIAEQIFKVGYDGIVVGSEFVRLVSANKYEALYTLIRELNDSKKK